MPLKKLPKKSKIIIVVGPTASGKSDYAIVLAKRIDGEIISADSRQVYRGMDLGTGKIKRDRNEATRVSSSSIGLAVGSAKNNKMEALSEKTFLERDFYSRGIHHHLLDVASPTRQYSVARWVKDAKKAIADILSRGKVPIIAGGTAFYIDALMGRSSVAPVAPNAKLRARLSKFSAQELFKILKSRDPRRAKMIDPQNKVRIIRALEIIEISGKKVPHEQKTAPQYDAKWIGLNPKPEILKERIIKRLDARLKKGMVDEVQKLHNNGVSWKRLESFGLEYRWIAKYFQSIKVQPSKISRLNLEQEMLDGIIRDSIRYSKRQMTWWKKNKEIRWITKTIKVSETLLLKAQHVEE